MEETDPPTWHHYVQNKLDELGWSGVRFEQESGISRTRLVHWRNGSNVSPDNVRAAAEAFNVPVLQAFVAAGFLTAEEARQKAAAPVDPATLTNDQLLEEVRRRMGGNANRAGPSRADVAREPGRYTVGEPEGRSGSRARRRRG